MPLTGSVANRIAQLHHEQDAGTASRVRSDKQIVAIAYATKRKSAAKKRK